MDREAVTNAGKEKTAAGTGPAGPGKVTKAARNVPWDDRIEGLYEAWHRRVAAAEKGHRRLADRLNRRYLSLGLPVVVLTTLVGTGSFASLQEEKALDAWVKLSVGGISVLAAALASAQTFLGYAQRAERHRVGAVRYETLRRDMAQQLSLPRPLRSDADAQLNRVRDRMEKYAKESPQIPERLWRRLSRQYDIKEAPPPAE